MADVLLSPRRTAEAAVITIVVIDLTLAAIYAALQLLGVPMTGIGRLFDFDAEANLPAWYSSIKLFCAAVLVALAAAGRWGHSPDRSAVSLRLLLLAGMLLAMSADEVAMVHERVASQSDALLPNGSRADTVFATTGIWMFLVGLPVVTLLGVLLHRIRQDFAAATPVINWLIAGFAVFFTGSLAVETLSNLTTPGSGAYATLVLFEETLELIGETILVWGAANLAITVVAATLARAAPAPPPAAADDTLLALVHAVVLQEGTDSPVLGAEPPPATDGQVPGREAVPRTAASTSNEDPRSSEKRRWSEKASRSSGISK